MRTESTQYRVTVLLLGVVVWISCTTRARPVPGPAATVAPSVGHTALTTHELASPAPPADWRTARHGDIPRSQMAAYFATIDPLVNQDFLFGDSTRLFAGRFPDSIRLGPRAQIEPVRGSASMDEQTLLQEGRIIARIRTYADASGQGNATGAYAKYGIDRAGTYYLYVDAGGPQGAPRAILMPRDTTIAPVLLRLELLSHPNPTGFAFARFIWSDSDDVAWGSCGGRCCRSTGVALQAPSGD